MTTWDHYKIIFLHPTLKYPAAPKIPSSVDTTKYPAWSLFVDIPWLLGHGTAWDHYKMDFFFHPTLKYPAAPKIPSSVDTTKYPAWSLFVDIPWLLGHRTAWDHYKMENYLHPTQKNTQLPQNTQLRRYQSFCRHPLAFGTWDSMGPMENYQKISLGLCVSIPWLWDVPG